jgi:protein O-mannosyl-transferase
VVGAIFVGVNMWFQAHANRDVIRNADFIQRLLGAGGVVWFYLWKALWPVDLAFIYPQWQVDATDLWWWLPLIAVIAMTLVLYWQRSRPWGRALLFAWGFFCVALLPVMGFTDVGFMRFSLVADHYQHIAIIGVITVIVAAACTWREHLRGIGRSIIQITSVVIVIALSFLTWRQCGMYRDTVTLYQTALEKNPNLWMLHGNLGDALFDAGRIDEAIPELREALRMYPDSEDAHYYLARSLVQKHQWNEGVEHYEQAIRLRPDFMGANRELAELYVALGREPEAIATAQKALAVAQSTGSHDLQRQIEAWIVAQQAKQSKLPHAVSPPGASQP